MANLLLEADMSQIESKIVFLLSGDPELQRLATLRSDEYDGHTENIAIIGLTPTREASADLKRSDPKLFKRYRHVGKITSHGAQRDMGPQRLSDSILKELGIFVSPDRCEGYLRRYHERYPAIKGGYFKDIRKRVMRDKLLVNSWGRELDLRYDRLDDELFRQAYSFLPQSENADHLNQRGVLPFYRYMKTRFGYPPNVTVHDSIVASLPPSAIYDAAMFLKRRLESPMLLNGLVFIPHVEFKLGVNWGAREDKGEGFEFKSPTKDLTARAHALLEVARE